MTKVALIQMSGNADRSAVLKAQREWVQRSTDKGGRILCFPELANVPYFCGKTDPDYFKMAEPIDGHSVTMMREAARDFQVVIVYPFFEHIKEREFYNTAAVIGDKGELIGCYRKTHIPCLYRSNGRINNEKFYFKPGNLGFPVFQTPFDLSIGILICYDRHYPEAARILSLAGADLLLIPTATSGMTQEYWEQELRAHAWFNHYYVGGVNRVGCDRGGDDVTYFGCTMFIDPLGTILDQADNKNEGIILGDVDRRTITSANNQWPFLRDRRPELYRTLASLTSHMT